MAAKAINPHKFMMIANNIQALIHNQEIPRIIILDITSTTIQFGTPLGDIALMQTVYSILRFGQNYLVDRLQVYFIFSLVLIDALKQLQGKGQQFAIGQADEDKAISEMMTQTCYLGILFDILHIGQFSILQFRIVIQIDLPYHSAQTKVVTVDIAPVSSYQQLRCVDDDGGVDELLFVQEG